MKTMYQEMRKSGAITVGELIRDLSDFGDGDLVFSEPSGLSFLDVETGTRYSYSIMDVERLGVPHKDIPGASINPVTGIITIGGKQFKEVK